MMGFVAALLLQAAPVEAEKARIASKPPLSESDRTAYTLPDGPRLKPREAYTLAVIPIGFSDRKPAGADLQKLFFDRVAGYYRRASGGQFLLRGKVYGALTLEVAREKFAERDLAPAFAAFLEREGEGVRATFDGVAFVAAGPMGARGTPLWPHKEALRQLEYILVPEDGGDRGAAVIAHEFMHLLGFADKYDDEKAAVGGWCILGTGFPVKDPPPPCADCRERLGWTSPAMIDPARVASLVLERDLKRSVKIAVNPDASEYLLVELQDRVFVWHGGGGRKIELVGRYPTDTSDRVTPLSEPSFRGRTVGARPIWITDIRVEGGRAFFRVGPDAPLTPLEEWRKSNVGKRLGD